MSSQTSWEKQPINTRINTRDRFRLTRAIRQENRMISERAGEAALAKGDVKASLKSQHWSSDLSEGKQ